MFIATAISTTKKLRPILGKLMQSVLWTDIMYLGLKRERTTQYVISSKASVMRRVRAHGMGNLPGFVVSSASKHFKRKGDTFTVVNMHLPQLFLEQCSRHQFCTSVYLQKNYFRFEFKYLVFLLYVVEYMTKGLQIIALR